MPLLNPPTQAFIEALKQRPDVLGVILFGSWARGNNRPNSDVDLVVIVSEGFKRTVEYQGAQAFEIIYTTAESAFEFWGEHLDDTAGLWEVAQILVDKDGIVQDLKQRTVQLLEAGKRPLEPDRVRQLRFDAEDQLRYIQSMMNSDPTSANMLLSNKVFGLTELFFDLRQIWTPAPKQRLSRIKALSAEFYGLLDAFYQSARPVHQKLSLVSQMISIVFAQSGSSAPTA